MPQSINGNLALRYCRENPDMATKTLARKLYREHPDQFMKSKKDTDETCIERARGALRTYRGQRGKDMHQSVSVQDCYSESGDARRDGKSTDAVPLGVKILVFDIETSPNMAYVWRCYKENINPAQMITETKVICWSAKWLGSEEVMFDSISNDMPEGNCSLQDWIEQDDSRVCATLYELFNEADIVVAHNGRAFDCTHLNTRWMGLGFPPPQPYQIFDTLKSARHVFNFPTNKLEGIAKYLGLGSKVSHQGFSLWTQCMGGDKDAWAKMEEYCVFDTVLLERVYMKIRAWDPRHPSVSLAAGGHTVRCRICASTAMHEIDKPSRTAVSSFPTYRCESCGAIMRGSKRYKPTVEIMRGVR